MTTREIDILVAEKVMGFDICHNGDDHGFTGNPRIDRGSDEYMKTISGELYIPRYTRIPSYSEHIENAWEILDKMRSEGWRLNILESGELSACFINNDKGEIGIHICESAPKAICLAALKAMGEQL